MAERPEKFEEILETASYLEGIDEAFEEARKEETLTRETAFFVDAPTNYAKLGFYVLALEARNALLEAAVVAAGAYYFGETNESAERLKQALAALEKPHA